MVSARQDEEDLLIWYYHCSKDPAIGHRAHVILLHLKGLSIGEIAQTNFKKESTVSRWLTAYRRNGIGSIFPGYYQNQNAAKLTKEQKQEFELLIRNNPLPNSFWDISKLKEYLSARFDVEYQSKQSYYALLKLCGYSYKLPSLFNIRRDELMVDKRMTEIKTIIKPFLKDPGYLVFASDETRIEWNTLIRRAWLRKGRKTVIKERKEKKYQNFIGFLNLKTGHDLLYRLTWQDQDQIIPVLVNLTETYPNKKIAIIWDNAGFHRGEKIRASLGKGNQLENIHLINLPPYAPDKNPQELIWRYGKDQISNNVYNQFNKLVSTFESTVTGHKFNYKIH